MPDIGTRDWSPAAIMRTSGAYWASFALHSGVELGIFTTLNNVALSAAELAERLGCDPRGTEALLTALTAMELLKKSGDTYSAAPAARRYLSADSRTYLGHIVLHHSHLVPAWSRLSEAVRGGAPTRDARFREPDEREHFLLGMFNVACGQAEIVAGALDLTGCTQLLDLGGGPGTYAVRFCLKNPQLNAVIYDLPTTRPVAESIVARFGLSDRIVFTEGDFLLDPIKGIHDVVWISQVLHSMDDETSAALLHKAAGVLAPGGRIFIQEFLLNDAKDGPEHPALFGCNMLAGTEKGKAYTEAEVRGLLKSAGAKSIFRIALELPQGCAILAGRF
ncbi:MAG: SAM-dependent methyltransferase [Desulfovibrio sp.]|jgi:SAM-dependent methyltransferase|nr:SAM-dependent methyltransferase [Desulfovibrio sp.]